MEGIKGYKVFRPDWTCCPGREAKQYTCPGRFEEEGEPDLCGRGMHFCINAADCFRYYDFDSNNKVAEIIAYGRVIERDGKCCTDKLEIVREIPWDEVLRIVNVGKDCTGFRNTGDCNTGDYNTGYSNTGDSNTGDWNSGHYNTGDYNTGASNTGSHNTGSRNTGASNTGDWNTGSWNTGASNTGDWNTGDWNTGNHNTGNYNTGDWNKSSFNTGCFMTEEPKIHLFNKPSDWTRGDWLNSDANYLLGRIPKVVMEWVDSENMTDEEKAVHPDHEAAGGYLKTLDQSECVQLWWGSLTDWEKNVITEIPNFDRDIFREITGIDVDED